MILDGLEAAQPSLRDGLMPNSFPGVETPGYYQAFPRNARFRTIHSGSSNRPCRHSFRSWLPWGKRLHRCVLVLEDLEEVQHANQLQGLHHELGRCDQLHAAAALLG
jgi:hypothetical protein